MNPRTFLSRPLFNKYVLPPATFILILFFLTLSHELGHIIVAISLGESVRAFIIFPDLSGQISVISNQIYNSPNYHIFRAIIGASGGIACAIYFTLLGSLKRQYLILVPLSLMDGPAEALYLDGLRFYLIVTIQTIILLFIALPLIKNWFFEPNQRKNNQQKTRV